MTNIPHKNRSNDYNAACKSPHPDDPRLLCQRVHGHAGEHMAESKGPRTQRWTEGGSVTPREIANAANNNNNH